MTRTRRLPRAATAAGAAVIMLVSGCGAVTGEAGPGTLVIGADLALTGRGSALGTIYQDALQLRVEQVNQQGLLGERRLELDVRDNRSDAGTSGLNITSLAEEPDVSVIVTGGCGACAVAGAESANQQGVPLIGLAGADAVAEPVEERRYVFKLGPNADHNAAALAAELAGTEAEVASIGLVAGTGAYADDGVQEMTDAADRANIQVPVTARVSEDEASLQDAADQVVAYQPELDPELDPVDPVEGEEPQVGPDAVVVWADAALADAVARDLRAAGYEGPLFLDAVAVDDLFLSGPAGEALEGATLIFTESLVIDTVIATSPAKAARKNWFNTYSARFGTFHPFSSFAADAVDLVVRAVNRLGSADRNALRDGFEQTQMDGISGPLRITPDNHSGLTSLGLVPLVAREDRWQRSG